MRGHSFLQLLFTFNCSDSEQKMEGELASLMEVYYLVKKAGRSATLTFSSKRCSASIVKLEIELDDAAPPSASTSSLPSTPVAPAPGSQRRQRRSKAKKAKANARAALHQAAQAAPTSASPASGGAPLPPPPPPPPPPPASRRLVTTVGRKASSGPSFSQLDGVTETSSPFDLDDTRDLLDEALARVEGVCETCDGHKVEDTCYFLCQGDSDCYQIIPPFCNGCKWKEKKLKAKMDSTN